MEIYTFLWNPWRKEKVMIYCLRNLFHRCVYINLLEIEIWSSMSFSAFNIFQFQPCSIANYANYNVCIAIHISPRLYKYL